MGATTATFFKNLYRTGLLLVALSFLLFSLAIWVDGDSQLIHNTFGIFLLNYGLSVVYFLLIFRKKSWDCLPVFLVLALISAYSLNRDAPVFEESVNWLCVLLIIYAANLLLVPLFQLLPRTLKYLVSFVLGSSVLLFLYLSLFVMPMYVLSLLGCIVFGIGLHTYVPAAITILALWKINWLFTHKRVQGWVAVAGMAVTVFAIGIFISQWREVNKLISNSYTNTLLSEKDDLPAWLLVAQNLPDNPVTETYLKADLLYTMPSDNFFDNSWQLSKMNIEEIRMHHPLVMIAAGFAKWPKISAGDRIKILESMYLSRHYTQKRLWSGRNLRTTDVVTNIRLWPAQRLAYTEKTITVANELDDEHRWNREEAIYTFHLPEGSVATSLSLWIDGVEQKGLLTTRAKADSAYTDIVGVQQRDPSLVHWQEGNTVSVRVFPVPAHGTRLFKLGITTPLSYRKGQLVYENIWMEGPDCHAATETRQLNWVTEPTGATLPKGFTKKKAHTYTCEGTYEQDWQISFPAPAFEPASFAFAGTSYNIKPYELQRQATTYTTAYLDINQAWGEQELKQVYDLVRQMKVYAYDDGLIPVTANEIQDGSLYRLLSKKRFSLFPFHLVADPSTSLVITKSTPYSPQLSDVKETEFGRSLAAVVASKQPVKVFHLGQEQAVYLRTLREYRAIAWEQGDIALLQELVTKHLFAATQENDHEVVVGNAMIRITSNDSTVAAPAAGTDHLMRLYAYNHIMYGMKGQLFPPSVPDTAMITEAERAYIVSPVSSLVVLETQADYDKYKIAKSNSTLGDATLKGNGAVPEPHEWALIILALGVMGWVLYQERMKRAVLK